MDNKKKEKKKKKIIDQIMLDELGIDKEELKTLKKKLEKIEPRSERGTETWFRLTSRNLYTRLRIVDAKANILVGANSIIASMVLSNLYPKLDETPQLVYAMSALVLTNVLSMAFAIFATIPPAWSDNKSITNTNSEDLMTFEDFSQMTNAEYQQKVQTTIGNSDFLYANMISDIHSMGLRLARKYRFIRTSYLIFLYGIIISVLMFAACHCLFE